MPLAVSPVGKLDKARQAQVNYTDWNLAVRRYHKMRAADQSLDRVLNRFLCPAQNILYAWKIGKHYRNNYFVLNIYKLGFTLS